MSKRITEGRITPREWSQVPLDDIIVTKRLRDNLDDEHVNRIMHSFENLGLQINPITLDENLRLVTGAHRLEAAKRLASQGVDKWNQIGAIIIEGATEGDLRMIELEENLARRPMSPLEIQKMWETYGEPVFKAQAKQSQLLGAAKGQVTKGQIETLEGSPLTGNTGKREMQEPVSLAEAARKVTGRDLDWLNKIADIRQIAQSDTAPQAIRQAAERAMVKLAEPDTQVEPVYQGLMKLQTAALAKRKTEQEAHRDEVTMVITQAVKEATLFQERLEHGRARALSAAMTELPLGSAQVRGIRQALARSLGYVLAVEATPASNPEGTLREFTAEVMQLVAQTASDELSGNVVRP